MVKICANLEQKQLLGLYWFKVWPTSQSDFLGTMQVTFQVILEIMVFDWGIYINYNLQCSYSENFTLADELQE